MQDVLAKSDVGKSLVSKKSAAIFLLMLLSIGSIFSVTASEAKTDRMIAATQPVFLFQSAPPQTHSVTEILQLPRMEKEQLPFPVPILDDLLHSGDFVWTSRNILGEIIDPKDSIPTIMGTITSSFGYRKHPVKGKVRHHDGIDLAAKLGAPVFAPAKGHIVFSGVKSGYGNVIEIDHGNGYRTLLAHHSKLLVKVGDVVDKDTIIANAGRTGIATGVHVHLEVRYNGSLINPRVFLAK